MGGRTTTGVAAPARRPGRPSKFGRPSKLVALTIPLDVLAALRRLDPDPARAIVALVERGSAVGATNGAAPPTAELVQLTRRDALIVINSHVVGSLPGVSILPLDTNRAFLALEPGSGLTELELAVQDRLDDPISSAIERAALVDMRHLLREWRRDAAMQFESRAIIVATRRR